MFWSVLKKKKQHFVWFLLFFYTRVLQFTHPYSIPTLQIKKLKLSSGQCHKFVGNKGVTLSLPPSQFILSRLFPCLLLPPWKTFPAKHITHTWALAYLDASWEFLGCHLLPPCFPHLYQFSLQVWLKLSVSLWRFFYIY